MIVEPFDPTTASEEELRALYDLSVAEHEELWNEDPVQPFESWRRQVTKPPSWVKRLRWVARDENAGPDAPLLGWSYLALGFTESNRDQADVGSYVRPSARRQGVGKAVIRPALDRAAEEGRVLLNGGAITDSPGTRFCEHLGADCKIVERKSRMVMAEVDRAMLEEWVVRAKERAVGYSLLAFDGPVPDEYLEKFVALTNVMNTAPRDDLEMEDWVHTPERHRENEQRGLDQGTTWWTLVARHDATDELCGYTELYFPSYDETVAWQEATAVDPAHRDKGLGRLLKATNALRLLDEKPAVRSVDTWNAFSNAPMLGINIAMGFEIVKSISEYQVRTDTARSRVDQA